MSCMGYFRTFFILGKGSDFSVIVERKKWEIGEDASHLCILLHPHLIIVFFADSVADMPFSLV